MRRLAKILLAGTAVATALSGVASSQTRSGEVINEQVLLGDVFAGQKLRVVDPAQGVTATGAAGGNSVAYGIQGGDLDINSRQVVDARVRSKTEVEVHGWTPNTTASSAATGNSGAAWATDGGVIDAGVRQTVATGSRVHADTKVRADLSSSGDTDATSAAIGNSQSFAVGTGAYARSATIQTQRGSVKASSNASLFHVKGQATIDAVAASNDVSHTGNGASGYAYADQLATGQTIASAVGNVKSGYLVDSSAQASANSLAASSLSYDLTAHADQDNRGYVRAESYLYVQDFGGVTSTAAGVGNSVTADNLGEDVELYTDQDNSGQVDVVAAFYGGTGYDVEVDATAYGNTVTGSVCSDCDGALMAHNRQTNSAGVNATATATINGSARSVTTNAHAVGNNAVFHVTRPGY